MTKERRLAIEMWKGIRNRLSASARLPRESIIEYKKTFCEDHGLRWQNHCWFCQYIPYCSKCPLRDCRFGSYYDTVKQVYAEKDVRVEACNGIIKALGGEV